VALLEPWFADGRRLHAKLETLFDQLMDSYLRLGRERKREGLLAKMLASGDRTLRAAALQRRATMLSDKGRYDEAWAVFHEAQREAPDDPGIGLLEVTLLVSRGDTAQARERARFWALRMERMRDPDMQPMIQFLREVAADPAAAFSAVSRERNPDLGRLAELFANAPVPAAHHQLEQHDGMAVLSTDAAITAVESRWREVYPQEKPHLTFMQLDTGEMWECAPDWLDFLERTPLAWHSFDVLDDLVLAIDVVQELGMDLSLLEPLLARASALLEAHVPQGTLPWLAAQNRPALRLLARQAYRAMDVAQRDPSKRGRFVELAERLIQLNPNDNHGFRGPLSHAYLELGEPEKMLALYSHYPGDHICEMALNRVLALYELGRRGEALSALAELPRQRDAAVKMLLAANPKPPREDASGTVLYGGKPEAWAYRETHLALWQRSGALAWLRDAQRALRRKNS
jgi:tetratricopeptide (TPR) repeat protein